MRPALGIAASVMALVALSAAPARAVEPDLPVVGGKRALATVNGDAVTLESFLLELASIHEGEEAKEGKRPRQAPWALLDRLITARLVVQEARNIGLDASPEIKREMEAFRLETLERLLLERQVREIRKADPAAVERRYRALVGEARVLSVLVMEVAAAEELDARLRAGAAFETAILPVVAAGKAKKGEIETVKLVETVPAVAEAVAALRPGEATRPIQVEGGFTLVKLVDLHVPEDAAARAKAEEDALGARRLETIGRFTDDLERRYAKVDRKLVDSLDFEAKQPGFEVLKKDRRVVAEISGGPPITVADLALGLERRFFHGTGRAAERKRINSKKPEALHELLVRTTTVLEARRLGLDRTGELRSAVSAHEEALLFDAFVKKVIRPEIRLDDGARRKFYADHAADYTTPETMRIESLVFGERGAAEDALAKLRSGADFRWTRQNAPGQLDPKHREDLLELTGSPVVTAELPENVRKALAGARSGDFRLCADASGPTYVLRVREVFPPKPRSFERVREEVAALLLAEKMKEALDDWARKLRTASEVRVHVTPETLDRLVRSELSRRT